MVFFMLADVQLASRGETVQNQWVSVSFFFFFFLRLKEKFDVFGHYCTFDTNLNPFNIRQKIVDDVMAMLLSVFI